MRGRASRILGSRTEQALRDGFAARLQGLPLSAAPPYHPGSIDERESWIRGWRAGDRHAPAEPESESEKTSGASE